jgi:hypothetical protein
LLLRFRHGAIIHRFELAAGGPGHKGYWFAVQASSERALVLEGDVIVVVVVVAVAAADLVAAVIS